MQLNYFLVTLILFTIASTCAATQSPKSFTEALTSGKPNLNFRYRLEEVEQDKLSNDSRASTLRTRLGYRSERYQQFDFYIELDDVRRIGSADYSSPSLGPLATDVGPKKAGQPVIADPLDTTLNQLYIRYNHAGTSATLGRQRIIRGNARFIGNVGWRQHEQTFDALTVENKSIKDLSVFAALVTRRNTISFTDIEQDTLLIDAQYTGLTNGILSTYYYDIQVDDSPIKWQNLGVRFTGELARISYALEFAKQENTNGKKPSYRLLEAGYSFAGLSLTAGIETLGSDEGSSFSTPLATLHKFNGWTDQFLASPAQGLEDKYLKIMCSLAGVKFQAVLHGFDSDKGQVDFGSEVDLSATIKIAKKYSIGAKYADYSAGDDQSNKSDANKFWLWAEASF